MLSADLLREARLRSGLTQAQLAGRAGTSQPAIARYESGRVQPSLERLRALIRACGLELGFTFSPYDDSYDSHITRQLALEPAERVAHMANVAGEMLALRGAIERARRA
jgi:transcriptional regulator with XRE-family HTH domain